MKKAFIIAGLSIFLTGLCRAQETERIWTLEECMDYAVQNSSKARTQTYTNDNYQQSYISALGNMMPTVRGSASGNWGFGRGLDPETNTYNTTSNFNNSYNLSATIPLFNGFAYMNQVRSARISRLRGDEELQKVRDDIALATMQAYVDVVYYTEAAQIAEEQLDESRKNLYNTQKQEELGLKGRPDVVQLEAEVATYEYTLIRQQNLLNTALLNLKDQMNYPFEDALSIDPVIPSHSGVFEENATEIFLDARNRLPDALISGYEVRERELSLAMARGQYFPSLSASGSIGTNYFKNLKSENATASFRSQIDNNQGKSVGFSLSIPIFNGFSQRSRVNQARNNLRIAEESQNESLRLIQKEIEQAVMDVENYAKEYAQAIKKALATEEAHRANQRKYEEGLISVLELQTSSNQLLQARVDRLNVELQYRIKCRLLDYYKGEPLIL